MQHLRNLALFALMGACDLVPATPDGPAPANQVQLMSALDCPHLAAEEDLCMISQYPGRLVLLGLESAETCELDAYVGAVSGSLGWIGNHVYACDADRAGLVKVSLLDGSIDRVASEKFCYAVTGSGTDLVVEGYDGYSIFTDFASYPGSPRAVLSSEDRASRLAASGSALYSADYSSDRIAVRDLASGDALPSISLEGHDGWNVGLGTTQAGELALLVPSRDGDLQIRDRHSGEVLRTVGTSGLAELAQAMTCGGALFSYSMPPPPQRPSDPVTFFGDCDDGLSTFDGGSSGVPEVHVVAVHESRAGAVDVEVSRSGDILLVLSAYSATTWNVTTGPSTNLVGVIVSGYQAQAVNAGSAAGIDVRAYERDGQPYSAFPDDWYSHEARRIRFDVEAETGQPMRSFSGCGRGASFSID